MKITDLAARVLSFLGQAEEESTLGTRWGNYMSITNTLNWGSA